MDHPAPRAPELRLTDDAVGGFLRLPGPVTAELMGTAGFDFACIDAQHGLITDSDLLPMLQALHSAGTPAVVRVRWNDPSAINGALDRGAAGVVVPLVDTVEQARAAASACRYPPRGSRSYGPLRTLWRDRGPEPLCIVMAETPTAVDALPEILDIDGVDAVFVGPSDLAQNAGLPLAVQHGGAGADERYDALLARVVALCRERDVPVGIYCATTANVHRFRAMGFTYTVLSSDAGLLRDAAQQAVRAARPGSG